MPLLRPSAARPQAPDSPGRLARPAGIVAAGVGRRFSRSPEVITLLGSASAQPEEAGDLCASLSTPRTDLTLLTVRGEIDTLTAPQVATALEELLAVDGGDLAIDLDGVTFLASSGLGVLIHAAREAARAQRPLYVVVSGRAVLRPLEVTGSGQLFTIIPALSDVPGASDPV